MNLRDYADQAQDGFRALVVLGSVTAPGADVLPWDEAHCAALGPHKHGKDYGCRVQRVAASGFNASAPARWRELHSAVMVRCRREGHKPGLLARVWEKQKRGVLHVHPVLAFTTPQEKAAARAYLHHMHQLTSAHGFGFSERKLVTLQARAAAGYLSSYFVTGRKEKATLQQSVTSPDMPRSIIYVTPKLTQRTGCTMRRLRMVRFLHVRGWGGFCEGETFHVVDRYEAHGESGYRRVQEAPVAAP